MLEKEAANLQNIKKIPGLPEERATGAATRRIRPDLVDIAAVLILGAKALCVDVD
jgi:hypothetical protein